MGLYVLLAATVLLCSILKIVRALPVRVFRCGSSEEKDMLVVHILGVLVMTSRLMGGFQYFRGMYCHDLGVCVTIDAV